MQSFWHELLSGYQRHITEPGKQPLFLLLLGFIGSFLFIRFSVRMIRRGVRWWPGNVTPGGLHIHHVVFGIFFLLVAGIGTYATVGRHPWIDGFALVFGMGCGLVLDEFALLLHLEDVYWSEQGRKSVDAVIIGILITGLLLVGYLPLGYAPGDGASWPIFGIIAFNACFTVVTLLKGKVWTGLVGIMVPGVSWIGALRLARPFSPWARWMYGRRPRALARARRREARWHRRADAVRRWIFDLIAGKPSLRGPIAGGSGGPGAAGGPASTAAGAAALRVAERVAEAMATRMAVHIARSRARHIARMAARPRIGPRAGGTFRGRYRGAGRSRVVAEQRPGYGVGFGPGFGPGFASGGAGAAQRGLSAAGWGQEPGAARPADPRGRPAYAVPAARTATGATSAAGVTGEVGAARAEGGGAPEPSGAAGGRPEAAPVSGASGDATGSAAGGGRDAAGRAAGAARRRMAVSAARSARVSAPAGRRAARTPRAGDVSEPNRGRRGA